MNLDIIKPDATGKFSPLLYKWLTSPMARRRRFDQVFQLGQAEDRKTYSDSWRAGEIIIGRSYSDGYVSARCLRDIITGARGSKSSVFAYSASVFNARDITAEFWATYERIGRCAWDPAHTLHMIGDESRYDVASGGLQRTCNWCGAQFEGRERKRVNVVKWIEWSAVGAEVTTE